MLQEATGSCPAGKEITTIEECKLAGESLSLNLRDGSVVVGSWSWVPCGCASWPGGDIHFDTNFDNCGPDQNDGGWRSICKQIDLPPTYAPTPSAVNACTKDTCTETGECLNIPIPGCENGAIMVSDAVSSTC